MHPLTRYKEVFVQYLNSSELLIHSKSPKNLYKPISYFLSLKGKYFRPSLLLLGTELFGGELSDALPAALAIECFHDFSLIHDDIMDAAPLRRGKQSVHIKWDTNTAILSGDALLIQSYRLLEKYPDAVCKKLLFLFNSTAIGVCEGQQLDMDYANQAEVSIDQYFEMIEKKTATLLAAALAMGGIIAGASDAQTQAIYEFGINLGIAFQIRDDYLDAFGNEEDFGKQVGGDIIESKKTYLYLRCLQKTANHSFQKDHEALLQLHRSNNPIPNKVEKVLDLFKSHGVQDDTQKKIEQYKTMAFERLDVLSLSGSQKKILEQFGEHLSTRIN